MAKEQIFVGSELASEAMIVRHHFPQLMRRDELALLHMVAAKHTVSQRIHTSVVKRARQIVARVTADAVDEAKAAFMTPGTGGAANDH